MNPNDPYLAYYRQQQSGHGVSSVFRGAAFQRGHGVGSFLGGLMRTVAPLIRSGASALGKEALRSGVGFLADIAGGTARPREAAGARLKQFTGSLKRKADEKLDRVLAGGGYKRRRVQRVTPQSLAKLLGRRTVKRKKGKAKKRKPAKRATRKNKRKTLQRRRKRRTAAKDIFG